MDRIFLYGAGKEGELWLNRIGTDCVRGFIDSNSYICGKLKYGKYVYSIEEIKNIENVKIYITANLTNKRSIVDNLKRNNMDSCIIDYIQDDVSISKFSYADSKTYFEGNNRIFDGVVIQNSSIGYGTYIANETEIINAKIGRYSSIGPNVKIIIGQHPTRKFVSTHPMFYSPNNIVGNCLVDSCKFDEFRYTQDGYSAEIGNDVWIGSDVRIMEGVSISSGTIVAAGTVVVKDTKPYSIVAGNPGRIVRYRFDIETIEKLQKYKWWNKPISWIKENAEIFDDIDVFMRVIENDSLKTNGRFEVGN